MTPSQVKKQGKQAFNHNTLPEDICPYKNDTWNYHDWMDGKKKHNNIIKNNWN